MDFTLNKYRRLILCFLEAGYRPLRFMDHCAGDSPTAFVVLRHDVDHRPEAALRMAQLEHTLGVQATYNFRLKDFERNTGLLHELLALGHETGYHYEELAHCRGDMSRAQALFVENLRRAREFAPVHTVAMHGSPFSRFSNLDIWKTMDYRDFGLLGEPYLSLDYQYVLYLTDTGRLWNDRRYNIRDRVPQADTRCWPSTEALMREIRRGGISRQVMLNVHPGRWNPPGARWFYEWGVQWMKNPVKYLIRPWMTGA